MSDLEIIAFGPDDTELLAHHVEVVNTVRRHDAPWTRERTLRQAEGIYRHGWDDDAAVPVLARLGGEPVAAGEHDVGTWDNRHLAWVQVLVHPDHRRRGLGSELLGWHEERARAAGCTSLGTDGWDSPATREFGARHGLEVRSAAVLRRQRPADLSPSRLDALAAEAWSAAADYELVHRDGPTPDDELAALAELTAAINDAPTDDLDIEDEVYTPERIRAYERAWADRGDRMYRLLARHRATGELAGQSVVVVDGERPEQASQHDTSVARAHRGHRLGLLLKTEMVRWLRETEPRLESLDTWNAGSNEHMIAVNERLGYVALGRELELQKAL
ncbi:GNAT family N-acetyltransferase [Nocardioides sp. SYSU D00038]|uniref:GNAT family N-acetyltransferase n=1 Tax=Nocardioides sp. SYSU D00038 TaxID=2812554 RepID=UPI0019681E75|nr:GNAT family N-acetyltransferase [Nocardioides sp. SYSU D00038]